MSSNPPNLPVDTAAVNWTDSAGTLHLHVFTSNGYQITERYLTSGGGWQTGSLSQPGASLSATAWVDQQGGHVRVYATSADATIEWCLDGDETSSWYQGTYSL